MLRVALFSVLLAGAVEAHAGRACVEDRPRPAEVERALELGLKVRRLVDAEAAQVAIVGRVGSDLSQYGLRYSHSAFLWRDHPKGKWLVRHMLNECGTSYSNLFDEGLGNFFLDKPLAYEALVVIPSAESQARIAAALSSGVPLTVYDPQYSMIASPWSTRYQNSNQWLLEVLGCAFSRIESCDRPKVQAWLGKQKYQPSIVVIAPLARLGARLFAANTRFDDHSTAEWSTSHYMVVSVESVSRFLQTYDPKTTLRVVRLADSG